MSAARRSSLRLVGTTALVTSLGWLALFGFWLSSGQPGREAQLPRFISAAPSQPRPDTLLVAPRPTSPGALAIPVAGVTAAQLTDTFDQARAGGARRHDAIDIMAPRGTPVLAAAPGRVEKLFLSKAGGNTVYVRSPDGTTLYYYAHLDSYAPGLAEGAAVRTGDRLGLFGSTGDANPEAPHLHFAMMQTRPEAKWFEPSQAINPYPLLRGPQRP